MWMAERPFRRTTPFVTHYQLKRDDDFLSLSVGMPGHKRGHNCRHRYPDLLSTFFFLKSPHTFKVNSQRILFPFSCKVSTT